MSNPVVLVDATAVPPDRSGVGRYVDGVLHELDGPLIIACQSRDAALYRELAPAATVLPQHERIASVPMRFLWEQFVLPLIAVRHGARVILSPHYTMPLLARSARVVTFHDATFFSDPLVHTPLKRAFFRTWIRVSARFADRIIVPSAATARELNRFLRRPREFVVAHHGVDPAVFHKPTPAAEPGVEARFGGRPWIAFLGTIEPRKNVPALVRAYRSVVSRWDPAWGDVPVLALAGGSGWETGLEREIALVDAPGEVVQLGFIPLEEVCRLLGGAMVVSYPSFGEGFGLPVLEAMACGAPVLTTRHLALPEVGGTAVAYSETDDVCIASALVHLASDPVERARLAEAGFERSKAFTWRASALLHSEAFRAAYSGGGR